MLKRLRMEMKEQITLAISASFVLIIALTWNETIKKIVDSFVIKLSLPETMYIHQVVVALIVTVVCVTGIIISSRYSIKK